MCDKVILVSKEEVAFPVSLECAKQSKLISSMLEENDSSETIEIPLLEVGEKHIPYIIKFMEAYASDPFPKKDETYEIPESYKNMFEEFNTDNIKNVEVLEKVCEDIERLMEAADYVDVEPLVHLCGCIDAGIRNKVENLLE